MILSRVGIFRIAINNLHRRNYHVLTQFYSTHRLAKPRDTEQQVETPMFNKEFKGMKAEFPCVAKLAVLYVKTIVSLILTDYNNKVMTEC